MKKTSKSNKNLTKIGKAAAIGMAIPVAMGSVSSAENQRQDQVNHNSSDDRHFEKQVPSDTESMIPDFDLPSPSIEEIILASGLHMQHHAPGVSAAELPRMTVQNLERIPALISPPTIEEVVVMSGLHQQRTSPVADRVRIAAPTIEEIVVMSGLHQQGFSTPQRFINPTIEEIVLASGLHQQGFSQELRVKNPTLAAIVMGTEKMESNGKTTVSKAPTIEEIVVMSGLHQQGNDPIENIKERAVKAPTIEEIMVMSGLHQQRTVKNAPTIEEVVVMSGLHQQKTMKKMKIRRKDRVRAKAFGAPSIEEIVVASGLHQQSSGPVVVAARVPNPTIEEIVLASGLHQQGKSGTVTIKNPHIQSIKFGKDSK